MNDSLLQALSSLNLVIGAGVTVLIALLLVQRQRRPLKFLVAAFYCLMAYGLVMGWLARSGLVADAPPLLFTTYVISFAHGPVLYIYTLRLLSRTDRFRYARLIMFLPILLMIGALAVYHLRFPAAAAAALRVRSPFPRIDQPVMYALCTVADFSVVVYLFLAGLKVNAAARACGPGKAGGLLIFFWLYQAAAATYLGVLVGHMLDSLAATMTASTANGVAALAYFLYVHQSPEITQRTLRLPRSKSRPADVSASLPSRMTSLMTGQRIYREPDLTLKDVSDALGVSTNQLSAALNEGPNHGFRTFLNAYRLAEARELLERDGRSSILDIAFRVGFNSKTAFNTLFVRETGLTPKEYRKKFCVAAREPEGENKRSDL